MKNQYIGFGTDCNETVDCVIEKGKKHVTILRTDFHCIKKSCGYLTSACRVVIFDNVSEYSETGRHKIF